jgi:hypothetical protein
LILAAADQRSGSTGKLPFEIFVERVAQLFPDSTVGAQYLNKTNAATPNREKEHFSQHAETQPTLII